jgi:hypothetical protein
MKRLIFLAAVTALMSSCTLMAPNYSPSVKSVQALKSSGASPVALSKASVAKESLNKVSLRGSQLKSPYGSYSNYIEQALKKELGDAGLLDETSKVVVGTVLTKNDVDAAMSKGIGNIAAVFSVTKNGSKIFEKEITAHEEWPSSFVGAVAIPNALNAYPAIVNDLIANLFNDKEFLKAISK